MSNGKAIQVDVIKERDCKRRGVVYPGRVAEGHHAEIHVGEKIVLFGNTIEHEYKRNGTTGAFEIVETAVEYRRVFKIGDVVETASYNLSYHGTILDIKANTIIVSDKGQRKHMTVFEFDRRNHKFDLQASRERNARLFQEI